MIKKNGPAAVEMVRGLSDEELDHASRLAAAVMDATVAELINMLLIGHTRTHMESIAKAR